MPRLKVSLVLTGISIGLLVLYGADVGVAQGDDQGFLPFDHKTRGLGIGGPAMILPIIAFFISKNEPSKELGIMLIATGILIIIGGITVITLSVPSELEESGRNIVSESAPLLVVGAFQIVLGGIKLKKS